MVAANELPRRGPGASSNYETLDQVELCESKRVSNEHHREELLVNSLMSGEKLQAKVDRYRDTSDSDPIR